MKLEDICDIVPVEFFVHGLGAVPFVVPKDPDIAQMDFDRQVCDLGIKEFVRSPLKDEYPTRMQEEFPLGKTNAIYVKEIHKGLRRRIGL